MRHAYGALMGKFFSLYFCVILFAISLVTLLNLYVIGLPMEDLLEFNIGVILLEGLVCAAFLQGITSVGLKNVRKLLKGQIDSENGYYAAWREMVLFPVRMFWGMELFGVASSAFYHISEAVRFFLPSSATDYMQLIFTLLTEQTLALILAILIFTGARRLLRPNILKIPGMWIKDFHKTTFTNNLLLIFGCLLLITALSLLTYISACIVDSRVPNITTLVSIVLFDLCFAGVIYLLSVTEIKNDFGVLIEEMSSLLKGSRAQLKAKVPIVSNDEIGNLGSIFNKLQEKVSKEYDEIETELQLASSIQQGLLPGGERTFGPYTVAGICKPCHDVGGDFFDIIPLDSDKFTVVIGDVTGKGMPAALIMSAVLLLFRNEMQRGGTAPEILGRLNKMVLGLGMNDVSLTLGIAVFDMRRKTVQYASAGHVAPYILKQTGISQLRCSSLPLGIYAGEIYDQVEYAVDENDKFIFYTDGIIDAFYDDSISGFDAFEQLLCSANDRLPVTQQVACLMDSTEQNGNSGYEDDKTLVVVRYNENNSHASAL